MPSIFYDHQKFSTQKYGGISRYFVNLVQGIKEEPGFEYKLGLLYSENYYLRDFKFPLNNPFSRIINKKRSAAFYLLNQRYCEYLLNRNDFDLFHPTYYDPYFLKKLKKPFLTTIHDMTYERLPEYFWAQDNLTHNKRLNIENANHIIAISETTKADLLHYSNADPDKVTVIYHGIDLDTPTAFKPVPHLPKHYFLFVGDRSGYKNFYTFLNAFRRISPSNPDLNIVLSGGGGLQIAEKEYISWLKLDEKVFHYHVSDTELNYLYQNAVAFIYPSLHEGFGYPVLEAYKAGSPVVLSDTACFREIAADSALFFHPNSVEDLEAALIRVLSDDLLRNELRANGAVRLQDFPIQKSISETLNLYKKFT